MAVNYRKKAPRFTMVVAILTVVLFSCRQIYTPPTVATANTNYLVIDGFINSSSTDSTFIKLSRTVQLNSKTTTKVEAKAKITVESDANLTYALKEIKTGTYACAPLALNTAGKYRLRIVTTDNKTYLSDFVPVKVTPPIDSLNFTTPATGVQVYVTTHDDANATRYYRWDYEDTWEFRSAYSTVYIAVNKQIIERTADQQINECWTSDNSVDITLASSAKLTKDVIYQEPVVFIPEASEKLRVKYSVLVNQYALTEEAFDFWQLIKKNTEQLGSIFDAQPSQIKGNIHNINDASEPVFGYISVGTFTQKRIFVDRQHIPITFGSTNPYAACEGTAHLVLIKDYETTFFAYGLIPIQPEFDPFTGALIGYDGAIRECADCTLRGSNKKPAFWQ